MNLKFFFCIKQQQSCKMMFELICLDNACPAVLLLHMTMSTMYCAALVYCVWFSDIECFSLQPTSSHPPIRRPLKKHKRPSIEPVFHLSLLGYCRIIIVLHDSFYGRTRSLSRYTTQWLFASGGYTLMKTLLYEYYIPPLPLNPVTAVTELMKRNRRNMLRTL